MVTRSIPKSYSNVTGRFASFKNHGGVGFESSLEKDFYLLLEFDRGVESFDEQPITITYCSADGKDRRYTPDVLIHYRWDKVTKTCPPNDLCEIKYRCDLRKHWAVYKPKFKAAWCYAKRQGWRFWLITEREVRTPRLDNVRFLRRYRHAVVDDADICQLLTVFHTLHKTTPAALMAVCSADRHRQACLIATLWHLVANERIGADFNQLLTMSSPLWSLPEEGYRG